MLNFSSLLESIVAFATGIGNHISDNSGPDGYLRKYLNETLKVFHELVTKYMKALSNIRSYTLDNIIESIEKGDHSPIFYIILFTACLTIAITNSFFPGTNKRSHLMFPVTFGLLFCFVHGNLIASYHSFVENTLKSCSENYQGYLKTFNTFKVPSLILTLLCYKALVSIYTLIKICSILYVILVTKEYILLPEYAGRWDVIIMYCVLSVIVFIFAYAIFNAIEYILSLLVLSMSSAFVMVISLRIATETLDEKLDRFVENIINGNCNDVKNHLVVLFVSLFVFGAFRHLSCMSAYLESKLK